MMRMRASLIAVMSVSNAGVLKKPMRANEVPKRKPAGEPCEGLADRNER
jgi:hypothetical protein